MLIFPWIRMNKMKRAEKLELERIRKRIAEMEAQLNALRSWEADILARSQTPKRATFRALMFRRRRHSLAI